jgi:hypothetical protein
MRYGEKRVPFLPLFFLYFLITLLFPYVHCHASEGLTEEGVCRTGHVSSHFTLFVSDDCCELHDEGHDDDHHIHFLIGDHAAPVVNAWPSYEAGADRFFLSVERPEPTVFIGFLVAVLPDPTLSDQRGFFSDFSGLSPPLS